MSKRWFSEHQRDPWRRDARSKGYRARSAFKLKQIQKRFNVIREGDMVFDVGCHPGGWTQVAVELTGSAGMVIGVDLLATAPVDGAHLVTGDVTDENIQDRIREILAEGMNVAQEPMPRDEGRLFNTIVSDISPSLTGQYDMDQAISMELVAMVFDFTLPLLRPGGAFVTKIFQGAGIEGVVNAAKTRFSRVQRFAPEASRNSSSEVYLVCKNKLPKPRHAARGMRFSEQLQAHLAEVGLVEDGTDHLAEESKPAHMGFRVVRRQRPAEEE